MPDSDVVLVMMPPWEPKRAPLGIAYIAEYLRLCGFNPRVIDFNLRLYQRSDPARRIFWEIYNINFMSTQEIGNRMFNIFKKEIDVLVDEILRINSSFVGFSVNIASIGLAGKIATLIKRKDSSKKIIFGGTGCFWANDRRIIFPEDLFVKYRTGSISSIVGPALIKNVLPFKDLSPICLSSISIAHFESGCVSNLSD